jgi:hypothetical protein
LDALQQGPAAHPALTVGSISGEAKIWHRAPVSTTRANDRFGSIVLKKSVVYQ